MCISLYICICICIYIYIYEESRDVARKQVGATSLEADGETLRMCI